MARRSAWILVTVLAGGACAPDTGPSNLEVASQAEALEGFERPGTLPIDVDLSVAPLGSIAFWIMGDEWREDVGAPLFQGAEATISVSPERLPRCGAGARVVAFLSPDRGLLLEVPLDAAPGGGGWNGRLTLPSEARQLEVWLRAEGPDGCVEYDSDFGRNYRLPVHRWAPTRVHFEDGWSEWAEGALVRGGVVAVVYDLDRLPDCRVIYRGFPGWDVIAHAAFDGVVVPGHSVVRHGAGGPASLDREPALALFAIPWDATSVELWFENRQYPPTCQGWDSDYGRNYRFSVEP